MILDKLNIPALIASFCTGGGLAAMTAALIHYGNRQSDEKAFKTDTVEHLNRLEKHLESTDKKVENLEINYNEQRSLLIEIRQNQINHDRNDSQSFSNIMVELNNMNKNFKEIWQKQG